MKYFDWHENHIFPICLGTVQLGLNYGIANRFGQPNLKSSREIIASAWAGGINCFDTAQAYGNSEEVLGAALQELAITEQALVISKIDPQLDPSDSEVIKQSVEASCRKLRISQLFGMMLHRATWLDHWDRGLGETLRNCMGEGKIKHLGVSICSVAEAKRALANPDISMIQLPSNAWDQRMHEAGIFAQAQEAGKICFIRSIYLQGLLTLAVSEVKEKLPVACDAAELWQMLANKMSCPLAELAFRYALSLDSPLVVGAENVGQIRQNLQLAKLKPLSEFQRQAIKEVLSGHVNDNILNPSQWNVS